MAKKHNANDSWPRPQAAAKPEEPILTGRQVRWIIVGVMLTAGGFAALAKADPAARNWAGRLCPFLILGGYGVIGYALWKKD
ncbi:MAG: hypothetical protein HY401_05855 [Elusimicrobia bacterium]|nr:hypothetical protein [Elusimicrobiota bacterium]